MLCVVMYEVPERHSFHGSLKPDDASLGSLAARMAMESTTQTRRITVSCVSDRSYHLWGAQETRTGTAAQFVAYLQGGVGDDGVLESLLEEAFASSTEKSKTAGRFGLHFWWFPFLLRLFCRLGGLSYVMSHRIVTAVLSSGTYGMRVSAT